jgi:hypothetical protein
VVIRVWRNGGYLDLTMEMRSESGSTSVTTATDQEDAQPDTSDDVDVEPR